MNTKTSFLPHEGKHAHGHSNGAPVLGVLLALMLAGAAFFSGFHMGSVETGSHFQASIAALFGFPTKASEEVLAVSDEYPADLAEFWQVWDLLEKKFVSGTSSSDVTVEERVWGAIDGLVASYEDPYTVFFPPEDATQFEDDISGNFSGVGMEVGMREEMITIIAPLPETPAERAGLLPGDVIVKIDETKTDKLSIDEAVDMIRGERGTEVVLTIYREGETDFLTIPVVRDNIKIPTLKTEVRDGVFIIKLFSFNAIAKQEFVGALNKFANSDEEKLIVDLRGNPGGFLNAAVDIASYFLPTGAIVVSEDFGDSSELQHYRSTGKMLKKFTPQNLVLLTDGGSASASEIVAGALSQHDVATLIGEQTFGKGSVQELVELPDGASLKVTIARWLTPDGISISEGGLEPDIRIRRSAEQIQAGEDPQLEGALEFITSGKITSVEVAEPLEE